MPATTVLLSCICCVSAAAAQLPAALATTTELKKLSVEELMNIEVTSVSGSAQPAGSSAAAIAVLTGEQIRRSGVTTVPEALRMSPGIHVARVNSSSWAVSSRGFSNVRSEKLLVLTDTRSIYTPLFSGVFWEVQDYLLEDIDRIEVIRGPGATLWGSNAVNGVINITTKSAKDTQDLYFEAAGGNEERTTTALRYGGQVTDNAWYRVFAKYSDYDETFIPDGASPDDWHIGHAGFRADWEANTTDKVTFQGDWYDGTVGLLQPSVTVVGRPDPTGRLRVGVSGGNLLGRFRRDIDAHSHLQFRAYYDHTYRNDPSFRDVLDTVDLDFQHRFALSARQEATWGLNYRFMSNRNEGKGVFAVNPPSSDDTLMSAFVQDEISVFNALTLTLGTKLEHNDFSGFEVQPSARAVWAVAPKHTLWGAVSRAVRVPTRLERDIAIDVADLGGNAVLRLQGNRRFEAEELLAYELGYRWQALDTLSLDVAAFHNRYQGLASLEVGTPFVDTASGRTIVPIVNENLTDGRARGAELQLVFAPLPQWQLTAGYAYVDLNLDTRGMDLNRGRTLEGATPRHQFTLRSSLDLPHGIELDAQFRNLSAVRSSPDLISGEGVPAYNELDVRLAWHLSENIETSLAGRNLLHRRHPELGAATTRAEIERSLYGKIVWRCCAR